MLFAVIVENEIKMYFKGTSFQHLDLIVQSVLTV